MADGRRKRILIVSNDEQQFAALRELLGHHGYGIWTTWSGRDALEQMESKRFDVLVVDDYVPDLYVGQFVERVSSLASRPCMILLQAHQPRPDMQASASPGTFCVVEKSQPTQLAKAVESALRQSCPGRNIEDRPVQNGEH
jgi:DNA-binding NtrC family response regulator